MTSGVDLSIKDLRVRYGALWALNGLNLDVEKASSEPAIGPNGAGKSTLFSVLSGERRPTSGAVAIDGGEATASMSARGRTRIGVVRTFQ